MAIQYVPGGRRIMPPSERDKLVKDDGYTTDRSIGAVEQVYLTPKNPTKRAAGLGERVTIIYTRFWSLPRWTFVTEGRNTFGDVLATATRETFDEARASIEGDLRGKKIIA
jgi:hypothetical protein